MFIFENVAVSVVVVFPQYDALVIELEEHHAIYGLYQGYLMYLGCIVSITRIVSVRLDSFSINSRRNLISDFNSDTALCGGFSGSTSELNNISLASSWVIILSLTSSRTSSGDGNFPNRHTNFFLMCF